MSVDDRSPSQRDASREMRRRRVLFDRGARDFATARPDILAAAWPANSGVPYVCPLCLHAFPIEALEHPRGLTLEHAPPKALGGRIVALTCWPCNNGSGIGLDHEMQKADRPIDILRGEHAGDHLIRLRINDGPSLTFRVNTQDRTFVMLGKDGVDDPAARVAFLAEMQRMQSEGFRSTDRFNMDFFKDRYNERRARAGWLRAAYLVAFAAFGYRYICGPALIPVRQQIRHPEQEIIPVASFGIAPTAPKTANHLMLSGEPAALRGVAVQMRRHIVLLPRPNDRAFYQRVAAYRAQSGVDAALTVHGNQYEWPTTARHPSDDATA